MRRLVCGGLLSITGSFHSMPGRSLNNLLTAVARKMGLDIDAWGQPGYNDEPLPL